MNVNDYILYRNQENRRIQEENLRTQEENHYRQKWFSRASGIFIAVMLTTYGLAWWIGHYLLESKYKRFISLQPNSANLAIMFNDQALFNFRDTVSHYEKKMLHNANANLIALGKYYEDTQIKLLDTVEGFSLTRSGNTNIIYEGHVSYSGRLADIVYFRCDRDCAPYQFDLASGQIRKIDELTVGQMIVDSTGMYYINFADNNTLYRQVINGMSTKLTNYSVVSFALLGPEIIILGENGVLYSYNREKREEKTLFQNVNAFSFSNGLIVENNGSIIQIPGFGRKLHTLHSGTARILGASPLFIAFQENNIVYSMNMETMRKQPIYSEPIFAIGVYFTERSIIIYGRKTDSDGNSSIAVIEEIF